jgi:hypothetical protein
VRPVRLPAIGAATLAFALLMVLSVAPPSPPSDAQELQVYIDAHAQTLEVDDDVESADAEMGDYSATPGVATLAASGTNYDWAKLVLSFAGLPLSEGNITVFTRWMRQENGPDDWYNRNNPLNNGWGSGGGGGLGSYPNLVVAAENAAEAMRTLPGYQGFVAAFERSAPMEEIEAEIWASPWASGHYAYGGHWHYTPVEVVKAPAGAWGV